VAEDFITPAIRNGGTGSVQVGEVRAPDYRSLQAPILPSTDLPDNGVAARAAALHKALTDFEEISHGYGKKAAETLGARAGAAAGASGNPNFRTGFASLTAAGQSYNSSALTAYLIENQAQIDATATSHVINANKNPDHFTTTFTAARDAAVNAAPPFARPELMRAWNEKLAWGKAAVTGQFLTDQKESQRKTYEERINKDISRVAAFSVSENPADKAQLDHEHDALTGLIQDGATQGLYSQADADAMQYNATKGILRQGFSIQVDQALREGGPDGATKVLQLTEALRERHLANLADPKQPIALTEDEFKQMEADAKNRIKEAGAAESYAKQKLKNDTAERQRINGALYAADAAEGVTTRHRLADAARRGDISEASMRNSIALLTGHETEEKSDERQIWAATTDPTFLDWSDDQINALHGVNTHDKIALRDMRDKRNANWEGEPIVRRQKERFTDEFSLPKGTSTLLLTDDQKNALHRVNEDFLTRMELVKDSEKKARAPEIADQVIKSYHRKTAAADAKMWDSQITYYRNNHGPGAQQEDPDPKHYQETLNDLIRRRDAALEAAK
jgi:hypothetical protein